MAGELNNRIAEIAESRWNDERMSFKELASLLEEDGWGDGNPKCAANWVTQAWHYFNRRGDSGKCAAISRAFACQGIC